jgi:hypothetical protein
MPHAHHFLERLDRVTREQTEFALELYRDHEAVRFMLDHVTLPPGTDRVALAIDDPREGPFVLVTVPEGRFVTCLGKGMHHQHPVVERARIDALIAKVAEKRARREMAQRDLRHDEDEEDVFARVTTRGDRFCREDLVAVTAFEAIVGDEAWRMMLDFAKEALEARALLEVHVGRMKGVTLQDRKGLQALHRAEWAVLHLMTIACAGDRRDLDTLVERHRPLPGSPTFGCSAQGGSVFFLRSAWACARMGRAELPRYRDTLTEAKDWVSMMDAAMGIGAVALRHSGAKVEARRILESFGPPPEGQVGPDALRATIAGGVLSAVDDADNCAQAAVTSGRDMAVQLGAILPEGHALKYRAVEDVPEPIARAVALSFDADMQEAQGITFATCALPLAARASAEDFYLPREYVSAWLRAWEPVETIERLKRSFAKRPKPTPVRAVSPGRNDPCPCGSGKKWKKCHGSGR